MKPPTWFPNAARRTWLALLPRLAPPDDAFARAWLHDAEFELYARMDGRDRHHACEVARQLLLERPDAPSELVRAALLHDVGKAGRPFRLWQRVAAHLYTPATVPHEPRLEGLAGAWQLKRHHDRYGAQMIRAAGGSAAVAELVARHHRPGGDRDAALLKRIDDET